MNAWIFKERQWLVLNTLHGNELNTTQLSIILYRNKQMGSQSIRFVTRILKFLSHVWMKQRDDVMLYTIFGFVYCNG